MLIAGNSALPQQLAGSALQCKQKLVVTVAVASGAALATQTLQFSVPCLNRRAAKLTQLPACLSYSGVMCAQTVADLPASLALPYAHARQE